LQLQFLVGVFEFVLLIFSLSFHECAHAWMASRLGIRRRGCRAGYAEPDVPHGPGGNAAVSGAGDLWADDWIWDVWGLLIGWPSRRLSSRAILERLCATTT